MVLPQKSLSKAISANRAVFYKNNVSAFRNTVKNRSGPAAVIGDTGCK